MAAVQAPIASLAEGLKSLVVSAPSNETGEIKRQPREAKITEEEKKVHKRWRRDDQRSSNAGKGFWNLL